MTADPQARVIAAIEGINTQYELLRGLGPDAPAELAIDALHALTNYAKDLVPAAARLATVLEAHHQRLQRQSAQHRQIR